MQTLYLGIIITPLVQTLYLLIGKTRRILVLPLCMLGIFHVFVVICWLFSKLTFKKVLSGTLSECQTAWIQIRANILSVLIWVETVCKGYQQTAKVASSKERVNSIKLLITQNGNCGSHGIYKHFSSQLKKQMKMLSAAIFFHQKKDSFQLRCKKCRHKTDCSIWSSLFYVHIVC